MELLDPEPRGTLWSQIAMTALVSCLTTSYGPFGARAAFEKIPQLGLSHVELPIATAGQPSRFVDEPLVTSESGREDLQKVDRLLEQTGLRMAACHIASGNPLRAEVLELVKRKLDLASHFGVTVVVGEAGQAEDDQQEQKLHAALRHIGDHAARRGITYCCATRPGLCLNHHRMLEAMQRIDHPHIKLSFDPASLIYYNETINEEIALAKVCHEVQHVFLSDSGGEFGQWHFPALGYGGAVDFVRILELMRVTGFEGPYSIAVAGVAGEGTLALKDYHRRIVDSVQHLRNCGYFDE